MKQLYVLLFFFFLTPIIGSNKVPTSLNKYTIETLPPTATVTASATAVCQNSGNVTITFTGSGGTAPYTFVYTLNNGSNQTISSGAGSTVTVTLSTSTLGNYHYELVSVTSGGSTVDVDDDVTVVVSTPLTVNFTFNSTPVCSGTAISFDSTVSGGNGNYTYNWDFGDGTSATAADPSHAFIALGCGNQTFTVELTVTSGGCTMSRTHTVQVKQKPDINFFDVNAIPVNQFSNCQWATAANPVFTITVGNSSASSCITSYSVSWGDGQTESNITFPITHTYTQLGTYNMTFTAIGSNGCTSTKTYLVKNISNPSAGVNSPGGTQNLCIPTAPLQFTISNWATNSPGTSYSVDYGDGSPIETYTQEELVASIYYNAANPALSANFPIPHSYTTVSCPAASFTVTLVASNACNSTTGTVSNISTISAPEANFTAPLVACMSSNVLFTNTTVLGYNTGCDRSTKFTWNFGDPASGTSNVIETGWLTSSPNVNHTFSGPGTYTVTLTTESTCGTDTESRTICIEAPLSPQFTLSQTNGCGPLTVSATNTTNLANTCAPPVYNWNVSYAAGNCGSGATGPFFAAGSSASSANPTFTFSTSGIYSISLTTTNSCGSVTSAVQTVVVKQPPTANIGEIGNYCGSATITPTATIANCAPMGETISYAWSFPGGSPATSSSANPGPIQYVTPGNYTISLVVSNGCGTSVTASETFIIDVAPTITNSSLAQTVCSGQQTIPVPLTATPSGTTFSWTATATPGITGFAPSGSGASIPAQTLISSASTTGTVTYSITPSNGTCPGDVVLYVITVNPAPLINVHPAPVTACQNTPLDGLTVGYANGTGSPSYQWYSNTSPVNSGGTLINGATDATYTPPSSSVGVLYYYAEVSFFSGGCSNLVSNPAAVTITPPMTISTQPSAFQTICVGGSLSTGLTVAYTGGAGSASYQWYSNTTPTNVGGTLIPGATSATYDPPAFAGAGTFYYYVVVTSSGTGCNAATSEVAQVDVVADPEILEQPLANQTICAQAVPTALTVQASGGFGTLQYQWYSNTTNSTSGGVLIPGATSSAYTPSTATVGTLYYYVVVSTNASGCSATSSVAAVIVNPSPTIVTQPLPASVCQGGTLSPLSVSHANGTGTPSYQWYVNTVNNNASGTAIADATNPAYTPVADDIGVLYYYVVITFPPSGGCSSITSATAMITITPGTTIDMQPTATQSICVGGTVPALSIGYSGGTGTPAYQWYSNTTASTSGGTAISGASSPSYTPPAFNIAGTYYYYAVVSLDGNGCGPAASQPAEIIVVPDPQVTTQPLSSQTVCQGVVPQTLTVAVSGGLGALSYQWFSNTTSSTIGGTALTGAITDSYTPDTSSVGTLYYYAIITQAGSGCAVTSDVSAVTVNLAPSISQQPNSQSVCEGASIVPLSVAYSNGTGAPSYQWYSNTVDDVNSGIAIAGANSATFSPPASTVGTLYYYVIISLPPSGGCSEVISETAAITIHALPTISIAPLPTQMACVGGSVAPLVVEYEGGTGNASYQWFSNTIDDTTSGVLIPGATQTSYVPQVFTSPGSYFYYVVVTLDGAGCGTVTSATAEVVVVSDPEVVSQPHVSQELCQNAVPADLTVAASGGVTGSYAYQWYSNISNSTMGGTAIDGATNSSFTPSTSEVGTLYYYVVITQPSGPGCSVTSEVATVIVNPGPEFTAMPQSHTVCSGQSVQLSVQYTNGAGVPGYQWFSNTVDSTIGGTAIPGATTSTFDPPIATVGTTYYYVMLSLGGGCEAIASDVATINVNANPIISSSAAVICSGNSFLVTPDESAGDLVPNGTTYTWGTPVVDPPGSVVGATAEANQQNQISQLLTNQTTSPATVVYTVTPVSGLCVGADFTVTVTVNPSISANVTTVNSTCYSASNGSITTNITGGIPFPGTPYQISWTGPGNFSSSDPSIFNLQPGIYTLTVDDAGGCPFSESYTITEPDEILISVDSENDITCFGDADGAVSISVTGGTLPYSYTWTKDMAPYATIEDIAALGPGIYAVSVTDANNCGPAIATFTITEPPLLTLSLSNQTNIVCYGAATGAINVTVGGGIQVEVNPGEFGYHFLWTGPNGFSSFEQNIEGLFAGTYSLVVTDQNGCTQSLSVTLTQNPEIIITAATTPITCYGANNASIALTVTGGVAPYHAMWSNLATGMFQDNLAAGTYVITIVDALGCEKPITVVIPDAPVFMVDPIVQQISCFGANDGSINLNLTGGQAPVTMTWTDGSTAGLVRNNLAPGTYTATISDGTPCHITRTFTIVEPQIIQLSAVIDNVFACDNANSGSINLTVAGGTPPYSYSWSNGAVTEDLLGLASGAYHVTVTDSNGCTKTAQYTLVQPAPILIDIQTETLANCANGFVEQVFTAQVSGGVAPYQYTWSSGSVSGANGEVMTTSQNTMVVFEVTDSLGCIANYTFDVDVPEIYNGPFTTTSVGFETYGVYSIVDPIQFTNTAAGDWQTISWNFGDGAFSTDENPTHSYLVEGEYVVTQTVTYPYGCVYTHVITLIVKKGYFLEVPNAFTPNDDSLNDTFRPIAKGLSNLQLLVYDTWGSLIYSEEGVVLRGWDGKIKGKTAENGNYYCKVVAVTFYGTTVNAGHPFVLIN